MNCVSLITDFGTRDEYTGVMKGVILTINPMARIVDITHGISPQDILAAAYTIEAAWRYFPKGTIHMVVVDPGVGTRRAVIAAEKSGHRFLAPDNGVLSLLIKDGLDRAVRVENPAYFLNPVSQTFHGRDIFAPAAGHLSLGLPLESLGPDLNPKDMARLAVQDDPFITPDGILTGQVISVDRFGNLLTNISYEKLQDIWPGRDEKFLEIRVNTWIIQGLSSSYAEAASENLLAIIGSRGYLEIAVNRGNAQKMLKTGKGGEVKIGLAGKLNELEA
jgi:hypothetical protein